MNREWVNDHRAFIAVAEACWRERDPSYSWHVLDWMSWNLRRKYPLIDRRSQIINFDLKGIT